MVHRQEHHAAQRGAPTARDPLQEIETIAAGQAGVDQHRVERRVGREHALRLRERLGLPQPRAAPAQP